MLKERLQIKIIWFFFGVIVSLSVSVMWTSGTWNLDHFFDVGEIYDVMEAEYTRNWNPQLQKNEKCLIKELEEPTLKSFPINGTEGRWNWFLIEVKSLNQPTMTWKVQFYQNLRKIQEETVSLKEGLNAVLLKGEYFNSFRIIIEDQKGLSFEIEKMQFYEKFPTFNGKMIVIRTLLAFIFYTVISICIYFFWKKIRKNKNKENYFYKYIKKLQLLFRYIANIIILDKTEKISHRTRRCIRVSLLLFLIFYMNYFDMKRLYMLHFPITIIVSSIGIFFISAVSIEKRTEVLNWKNPICYAWFGLWTIAFFSEALVKHEFSAQAPIMIFVFGFFYFVIGNMQKPEYLLYDIVYAIEILFWFSTFFCIFFRPLREGYRYLGASQAPAVFAMFQAVALASFLGKLEKEVRSNSKIIKKIFCLIEILISFFFILKTGSFTILITSILTIIVSLYFVFLNRKKYKKLIRKLMVILPILIMFVFGGMNLLLKNVPFILESEIMFEYDNYREQLQKEEGTFWVVQAASKERILEKIKNIDSLDTMTSGRITFWKEYIRDMNLWGHESDAIVRAKKERPHNAVIAITYRYGILATIPYVMVLFYSLYYSWRNIKYRRRKSDVMKFLPLGYFITILIMTISENVELPFLWIPWFILYLMFGFVFSEGKAEGE